jgi:hypothetical protein
MMEGMLKGRLAIWCLEYVRSVYLILRQYPP